MDPYVVLYCNSEAKISSRKQPVAANTAFHRRRSPGGFSKAIPSCDPNRWDARQPVTGTLILVLFLASAESGYYVLVPPNCMYVTANIPACARTPRSNWPDLVGSRRVHHQRGLAAVGYRVVSWTHTTACHPLSSKPLNPPHLNDYGYYYLVDNIGSCFPTVCTGCYMSNSLQ